MLSCQNKRVLTFISAIEHITIQKNHRSHGFDDGNGTGQDTGIVASASLHRHRISGNVHGLLLTQKSSHGLKSNTEVDVFAVADASLNAATSIRERTDNQKIPKTDTSRCYHGGSCKAIRSRATRRLASSASFQDKPYTFAQNPHIRAHSPESYDRPVISRMSHWRRRPLHHRFRLAHRPMASKPTMASPREPIRSSSNIIPPSSIQTPTIATHSHLF